MKSVYDPLLGRVKTQDKSAKEIVKEVSRQQFGYSPGGSGGGVNVRGPDVSTDNAIARYDGVTGKRIQNSNITIDDNDDITMPNSTFASTGFAGGKITNANQFFVELDYTQNAKPATGSGIGSAFKVQWDANINETTPFVGPTLQPGDVLGPAGVFQIQGTLNVYKNMTPVGPGPIGFQNQIHVQNDAGSDRTLVPDWGFVNNWVYTADGATVKLHTTDSSNGGSGFVDNQVLQTVNGGTMEGTTNNYYMYSFLSHCFVNAGVTIPGRYGYVYHDLNDNTINVIPGETPVGTVTEQIAFKVPYLYKATKNIGVYNSSNAINPPQTQELDAAGDAISLTSTNIFLNNSTGGTLTLTSTPTIPDGYEDGHMLTLYNDSADTIVLQGEADLTGSNIAETHTIGATQSIELMFASGAWVKTTLSEIGDVVGPASSTDNAIARFNLTTGKLIQNSSATVQDDGSIYSPALYNGTTVTNDLAIGPYNATLESANTGRIKPTERFKYDTDISYAGITTGIFREWYYYEHHADRTIDITNTGNLGAYRYIYDQSTIKLNLQQTFSVVSLLDADITIEPTAASNFTDNQSEYIMFTATPKYIPNVSTASTVTANKLGGFLAIPTVGIKAGSHASAATVVPVAYGFRAGLGVTDQATVTNFTAFLADSPSTTGTGVITNAIGLYVSSFTKGTNRYGVAIEAPATSGATDTQTLWVSASADNTTAAAGIAFGLSKDTNLYRSAANTLKTDDSLVVGGTLTVGTPATYTPTNVSTDRSFDANATDIDELADVVGTLIADLQAVGVLQ